MELFISTYGSYIRKNENCFEIKTGNEKRKISSNKVESILISNAATISTDAIQLSMEKNIDVVFLDQYGNPYARIWHSKLGSTTLIRRKQLEIADSEQGLCLVCDWIDKKITNQIDHLKDLRKTRTKKSSMITNAIKKLEGISKGIGEINGTLDDKRENLLGIEGSSARIYFNLLSNLMPDRWKFNGRSRNPARDPFNAFLNYAYGILYGRIEKACIIAGLDPYIGFMHTDNYNKKSLVFDLIERYRVWADKIVMKIFAGRKVKTDTLKRVPNGYNLNKKGKQILIQDLNNYFEEKIRYNRRNVKRINAIQLDCHRLANSLIE